MIGLEIWAFIPVLPFLPCNLRFVDLERSAVSLFDFVGTLAEGRHGNGLLSISDETLVEIDRLSPAGETLLLSVKVRPAVDGVSSRSALAALSILSSFPVWFCVELFLTVFASPTCKYPVSSIPPRMYG